MNAALLKRVSRTCEAAIGYGAAPEQETVSTSIPQLDTAMCGIPKGRIIEIFGEESSGKTALALHLARNLPGPVLYADADCGLSPYMLGKDADIYLLSVPTLEDTLEACQMAAIGGFSTIVIDTVTSLPTRTDIQIGINSKCIAPNTQAKVLSQCLPILNNLMRATGCTLILVSQLRNKPGILIGDPSLPTSGRAARHYAALRLRTKRLELLKDGRDTVGQKIRIKVEKSKYAPPDKAAEVNLIYGKGIQP